MPKICLLLENWKCPNYSIKFCIKIKQFLKGIKRTLVVLNSQDAVAVLLIEKLTFEDLLNI